MSMTLDDSDVIRAFRLGDDTVFDDVVAEYRQELLRHARRRTPDDATAEDLVQEAFVRAYRSFGRLPDDSRVRPWLHQILRNLCIDDAHRRRRELDKIDRMVAEPSHAMAEVGPEIALGLDVDSHRLGEALAELPTTHRDAFVQRVVVGLDYDEIAEREGVTETNARARVSRARTSLRRALQGVATIPLAAYLALRRPGRSVHASGAATSPTAAIDPTASTATAAATTASRFANTIGPAVDLATSTAPTAVQSVPLLAKAAVGIGAVATMSLATAPEPQPPPPPVVVDVATASAPRPATPTATPPPPSIAAVAPAAAERPERAPVQPVTGVVAADATPAELAPVEPETDVAAPTTVIAAPVTPTATAIPEETLAPTTVPAVTATTVPASTTTLPPPPPPAPLTGGSIEAALSVTQAGPRLDLSGTGSISTTPGGGSIVGRIGVSEPDPAGSRRLDGTITLTVAGDVIEVRLAGYGLAPDAGEPGVIPTSLTMSGMYRASGATGQLATSGSFSGSISGSTLRLTLAG